VAFILNNTNKNLSVLVIGQFNQAQFFLGPNQFATVGLTAGLKALVAFSNQGLFALRPIQATASGQTFLINPSGSTGPVVRVYSEAGPDQANLDNFLSAGGGQIEETDLIQPLSPPTF
jgi:hypothetical protein